MRTEHRDQASICPFALREVSVLAELALGHLRYSLTDVPPQSNSPPGSVLGSDHARECLPVGVGARRRRRRAAAGTRRNRLRDSPTHAPRDTGRRQPLNAWREKTVPPCRSKRRTPSAQPNSRIPLVRASSELIVERRPRRQEARPRRPHRRPQEGTDPIRTRTRPDSQRLTARKIRVRPRRGTEQRITTARTRGDATARRPPRHTARRNRRSTRPGPAPGTSTLPDQARYTPILRANPWSEVTDQVCRLPLPTLFYRLEALNLGDLLRIWVRSGANFPRSPLPDFQGPRGRSGHRRNCGALRVQNPISLLKDSRELERL
ncbi:hypothetical protein J6590_077248 [Homalodisca vitripennis]|nr:hypothetical protein J6590_077248 [Homalodisca vitripennis]